jgi:hypothetical protein
MYGYEGYNDLFGSHDEKKKTNFIKQEMKLIKQEVKLSNILKYVKDKSPENCIYWVSLNGKNLRFVPNKTSEICKHAINNIGRAIEYVKPDEFSSSIMLELYKLALEKDPFIFHYIAQTCGPNMTHELQKIAVSGWAYNIKYIKNPSEELCLIAVKRNAAILDLIKNQTENVCIEAVKTNKIALKFVKNKTSAVCKAANLQNSTGIA